jgi:hypothetical protein
MKTSELTGAALDWAVAKCEGVKVEQIMGLSLWSSANWKQYSTNWAQGGPIIERTCASVSLMLKMPLMQVILMSLGFVRWMTWGVCGTGKHP